MPKPHKVLYGVKNYTQGDEKKARWTQLGVAFENRDGSFNIILDYLPLDGKLNMRDPSDREE